MFRSQGEANLIEVARIGIALLQPVHHPVGVVDRQTKLFEDIATDPANHRSSVLLRVPVEQIQIVWKNAAGSGSESANIFQDQGPQQEISGIRSMMPEVSVASPDIIVLLAPTAPTPRTHSGWDTSQLFAVL